MLSKIFKGTGPGVLFLIALTLGASWADVFIHPRAAGMPIFETEPMPLYGILKFLLGGHAAPGLIFTMLCLCLVLFLLVNFNTTVFFINERTFLPALFYILIIAVFPEYQIFNPVLPASLFLLLAMRCIINTYRKEGTAYDFFDAGIFISIGSLFYANLIWFGALVIIGIIMLRNANIREIIIALLGMAAPFVLTAGLYYVLGRDPGTLLSMVRDNLFERAPAVDFSRLKVIVLIYMGLMLIVSMVFLLSLMNSKKIKSRKTFSLLIWCFIISLALFFLMPSVSVEMIWITAIPAGYFLTHYFVFQKRKIFVEIVFSLFILLTALIQVFFIF
ncbi:MAG: DUF6427 family protein [Bacteroidales bacterium]|jgi:hypothetical protein